ncbi:hypothetical protein HAX54_031685, partial [Datura stramonium]|nr:hypothetical protein [Datura stramonium]
PIVSSLENRPSGTLKLDSGKSSLANYFDSEIFTTVSDFQEQHSCTENLSGASSSSDSSLDYNQYFHRPSLSEDCLPEGLLLESVLMGPDEDASNPAPILEKIRGTNIKSEKASVVSITGDPIQRLGAYIVEGLIARKELSGTTIYRTLRCKEPAGKDLFSYMHILYEICPYLKFGYMAANGAIVEACRNEDRVHIIDFQIAQGTQWMTLLQALAARPGGAPYVRITGIDDPATVRSGRWTGGSFQRLSAISEKFNIRLSFMQCQFLLQKSLGICLIMRGQGKGGRHELLGKWKSRFMMAGFQQYPLSSYVNSVIKDLLRRYSEHYTLVEKDGAMLLGWQERNLVSASAWF